MTVFPPKNTGFAEKSVYPATREQEAALPVIGLPGFVCDEWDKFVKGVKEVWNPTKKEEPPKKVPEPSTPNKLAYEKEIPSLPREYKIAGDGGGTRDAFYRIMTEKYGIPVKGVSYGTMKRLVGGNVEDKKFVGGLHVPNVGIYVSEDDGRSPVLLDELYAAGFHELGHALEKTKSEPRAHKRGKRIAIENGFPGAYRKLVEMELENPHLR